MRTRVTASDQPDASREQPLTVDTNPLACPANADCAEHQCARAALQRWLSGTVPWSVT